MIWRTWVAHASGSPSALLVCSKGKETQYIWYQFRCRSCRRSVSLITDPHRASLRFFLSGLTPLAFPIHLVTTRQWYYLTHSWAFVHEHQGIFHSPVGLHTACLGPCSSAWGRKVPSFQYRRGEALHRGGFQRRGFVLAERDLLTRLSFSHYC